MPQPLVSIVVIDYKKKNPYLTECIEAIEKQTYKNFEIILICDYKVELNYPKLRQKSFGHYVGPAEKRDVGGKMAKGKILAFIDDDAFPSPDWLKNMVPHFRDSMIAGVGGPGVTPPGVSWQEQSSGWASASPIGAGPYIYRFLPDKRRFVDDYPSMNLAVRKADFEEVRGYDSNFWPGEDTKLCLDLTHKLGKKIIYDPQVLVYHHRRPIWKGHLKQNGNFGLHRGFFARILPQTSLQLVYFLPSFLLLGLIYILIAPIIIVIARRYSDVAIPLHQVLTVDLYSFVLYFFMLFLNSLWIYTKSNNQEPITKNSHRQSIFQAALSIPVIFVTHLWYGTRFLQGFLFTEKLVR